MVDFGYSAPLAGKDGSYMLTTTCGSEFYMAPEILEYKPYSGVSVDIFATGLILYIMLTKS
jgi:serine/threonine protein kinase